MQISKIMAKKFVIPALLLAGCAAVSNVNDSKNNFTGEQNVEFLAKNPNTLANEAMLFPSLFGFFRRKRSENDSEPKNVENKIPQFSGILPEDTKLQMTEFGYPMIDKDAAYAIKEDFEIPEGSTITYPDGTTKDIAKVFEEDGINLKSVHESRVFIKDKDGNIFSKYYSSDSDKGYSYFDTAKEEKYYAISEDGELYSVDFAKLPEGQEFIFNKQPFSKEIIIPNGTVIKYDNKALTANEKTDYCSLHFFKAGNGENYFGTFSIWRPDIKDKVVSRTDLAKQDEMYQKLIEAENQHIAELNEKNKTDNRPRNMVANVSRSQYEYCSPSVEEEVTDNELNFYKQVYDYYTSKNEEYGNYQFVFQRRNSKFELKITDGENVIATYIGIRNFRIDSPIFNNTRVEYSLGDFKAIYPN